MASSGDLEQAYYARMRWNTPLSESHAALLLDHLNLQPGGTVLDLGCGWGELLLRAVAGDAGEADVSRCGTGVDLDRELLDRGRALASERGLSSRVEFVQGAAEAWATPADRVVCVGASHAWGGTQGALRALPGLMRPGGRLLFGDGFWERRPSEQALAIFGDGILRLEELVETAREAGWEVLYLSAADQREWDDFESAWRAGRQEWLLAHPTDARVRATRAELADRLTEYVSVYRGVLGFCYLILAPS